MHRSHLIRRLLVAVTVSTLFLPAAIAQAALDAEIDLTNPRVVPLHTKRPDRLLDAIGQAQCSGFLYSSRIVFTAAHCQYSFDNSGNPQEQPVEVYVGLPNSNVNNLDVVVKVIARFLPAEYTSKDGFVNDFVINVLEKDLIKADPVELLTPEIAQELINTKAKIKVHGYGEYLDRCAPGEKSPCLMTTKKSLLPRSIEVKLSTLEEAEQLAGFKAPYLSQSLTIFNGKQGAGCGGDSGGSLTTIYKGKLLYLGPTPNGVRAYACGASGDFDEKGGIQLSSPIYKHLDILKKAQDFVSKQLATEQAEAKAKAEAEAKVAAEKAAVELAAKQEAEAKAKAEAAAKSVQQKKITITCVKGKVSKKVTGINPKCPAGYKKK